MDWQITYCLVWQEKGLQLVISNAQKPGFLLRAVSDLHLLCLPSSKDRLLMIGFSHSRSMRRSGQITPNGDTHEVMSNIAGSEAWVVCGSEFESGQKHENKFLNSTAGARKTHQANRELHDHRSQSTGELDRENCFRNVNDTISEHAIENGGWLILTARTVVQRDCRYAMDARKANTSREHS